MPSALDQVRVRDGSLSRAPINFYPEAASQSFEEGWLVDLSSGLTAAILLDGSSFVDKSGGARLLGIALTAASGSATTTKTIGVQEVTPATLLSISAYHATPASAITAIANVGATAKLIKVDRGATYSPRYVYAVDVATIGTSDADATVSIVGVDPIDEVGAVYGHYLCKPLVGATRFGTA